jgi:hypothetical protein
MDGCLFFNDLTLLIGGGRLRVPFDHIGALDNGPVGFVENLDYLSDPTFILAGNYLNLIVDLKKISSFLHFFRLQREASYSWFNITGLPGPEI